MDSLGILKCTPQPPTPKILSTKTAYVKIDVSMLKNCPCTPKNISLETTTHQCKNKKNFLQKTKKSDTSLEL